jgi:translation initiation factor 1
VISGLPLTAEQLAALAKKLKRACGVGGAVKGNTIEVQSENREQLLQLLEQEGFKGKLSGS